MSEPEQPAPSLPSDPPAAPAGPPGWSPEQLAGFRRRAWLVLALISAVVLLLDQGSKHWAQQELRHAPRSRITLIDDYLAFTYVRNPGAAWGFLARTSERFRHPFFIGVSLAAMLFILYIHSRLEPGQWLLLTAISLVMGGAAGNFVDRIRLRYVIDFIELHWRHRFRWPTFNVADIAISVGVGLLLLEMLFGPWWRRRRGADPAEP